MVSEAEQHQKPSNGGQDSEVLKAPGSTSSHHGSDVGKSGADDGSGILADMEHFVWLTRKVKNVPLLSRLLKDEGVVVSAEVAKQMDKAKGLLPPAARKELFLLVTATTATTRHRLERVAERIALLDDEYGKQAVLSLLDADDPRDATAISRHCDPHGRALYLFLEQEYREKGSNPKPRFDHAERVQVMNRQWKSEAFSSHYQGPKDLIPCVDDAAKQALKARVLELYPQAPADDVLIEHFTRRDLGHATRHDESENDDAAAVLLHTVTITFNGSEAHYRKVEHGEIVSHDDLAALSIRFSFEPSSGALSVFSDDRETRRDLAKMFRDVVLAASGDINDLPIREFDLTGFTTEAILQRLVEDRIDEVESIAILHLKVARSKTQRVILNAGEGRELDRQLTNRLAVLRDKHDDRHIYTVAREEFKLDDLSQFDMVQVTLSVRIAKQPHRKAHNIAVQITAPHGLNDKSKTEDDRKLVMAQLARLGILLEF